jgi:hypothetical protein
VLAGLGGLAITVNDPLEVHGSWIFDTSLSSYVLIASRVEKLTVAPTLVQLSGVVQAINGNVLQLNSAQGLLVQSDALPAGLAVGHMVRVWATQAAWTASLYMPLMASRVVDSTITADHLAGQNLRLSGPVANYNATSRTLELQGTTVQLGPQVMLDVQALASGAFVSLDVQRSGSNLVASSGALRGNVGTVLDLGQSIVLKAITSGIDWTSDPVQLNLRGVAVTAAASAVSSVCRQAGVGSDVLVEVVGRISQTTNAVVASQVICTLNGNQGGFAPGTIFVRVGVVSQMNLMTHTFNLQTAQGNVSVQWDMQTFFDKEFNMRPDSLTGQSVEVEGVNQTGFLRARTVKRSR